MKSYTHYLVLIRKRREYINITADVEQALSDSGIKKGWCSFQLCT